MMNDFKRQDALSIVEEEVVFCWNCPSGSVRFDDFVENDRKENPKKRCPHCGKTKAEILNQNFDQHQKLVSKDRLLDRLSKN